MEYVLDGTGGLRDDNGGDDRGDDRDNEGGSRGNSGERAELGTIGGVLAYCEEDSDLHGKMSASS